MTLTFWMLFVPLPISSSYSKRPEQLEKYTKNAKAVCHVTKFAMDKPPSIWNEWLENILLSLWAKHMGHGSDSTCTLHVHTWLFFGWEKHDWDSFNYWFNNKSRWFGKFRYVWKEKPAEFHDKRLNINGINILLSRHWWINCVIRIRKLVHQEKSIEKCIEWRKKCCKILSSSVVNLRVRQMHSDVYSVRGVFAIQMKLKINCVSCQSAWHSM